MPEQVERQAFSAIIDADELDTFLETISTLEYLTECKLHVSEDGVETAVIDSAGVCMIESHLEAAAFESLDATEGVLGINIERLQDVLGFAGNGSMARLDYDPEIGKLVVEVDHRTFTIALIDPDSIRKEPNLDEMNLDRPAEVTIEGRDFEADVKAADLVSDHVEYAGYADPERLLVTAEGDIDELESVYHEGDLIQADIPQGTSVTSLISLGYCKDIAKPIPADAEVTLRVGDEYPVEIAYDLEHGGTRYNLAPRIQAQ